MNGNEITICPYCQAELTYIGSEYGRNHLGSDHFYKVVYDLDEGGWTESLTLKGVTYYLADVARVCNLKAFT